MRVALTLALLMLLGACAGRPGELVYASSPLVTSRCPTTLFAGGAKGRLVGLVTEEWKRFGGWTLYRLPDRQVIDPVGGMVEDDGVAYSCLIKYWAAAGEDGFTPYGRCLTPWSDRTYRRCPWHAAWSAAFVSWAMVNAGVPESVFRPHETHSVYLADLVAKAAADPAAPLIPRAPGTYAPQPGDLVCRGRAGQHPTTPAEIVPGMPMHCDIVVEADGMQIRMIGGNVFNAVTETVLDTDHGFLREDGRTAWATVVENRYSW